MFIKIKNINDCSIFSFSYNSNEFNMISFINVISINVEDEVCEFEMRFRIYTIRISNKPRIPIFEKIINLTISFRLKFELRFFKKIIIRKLNVKFTRFTFLNKYHKKNILF